ncbi:hypothetical protein PR202_ga29957 [Eleusine coracana subsp. coracana]|uniref:Uncharacterized protein n=1 Tax=Eleusine coracana subsp. coracana TaxID=191504 RepID=A0AAV5DLB4_ELECO|nr:hypothetical protein PR202_ga29957 [Eleusine coracana subsp. coracana]
MPEDGRLCIASVEVQQLQLWVRGDGNGSDNGWVLLRKMMSLSKVYDSVPGLPRDMTSLLIVILACLS